MYKKHFSLLKYCQVILVYAASIVLFFICFGVVHGYLENYDYKLSTISSLKLVALSLVASLGIYALLSALSARLIRLNNLVAVNLVIFFVGAELILRVVETRLPFSIVEMLPKEPRNRLMQSRGLFGENTLSGDGMLYSWKPQQSIKELPWVKVDANGYRNPAIPRSVDLVVLGDSVTIAQNSKNDIADFIRKTGMSVLNLGFGGYGPFHQRDAYFKYILGPNIHHDAILINFCFCNDVENAQSYQRILRTGGTWRDYLGSTPNKTAFPFKFDPPWTISILFNLPFKVVQQYRNFRASPKNIQVRLPRGDIETSGWLLPSEPRNLKSEAWGEAEIALSAIIRGASAVGAKAILAYYPDTAQIYMPYISSPVLAKKAARRAHKNATDRLERLARREGGIFIDYTEPLQHGNAEKQVTTQNTDYHPNINGVEIMAETAIPVVRQVLGR